MNLMSLQQRAAELKVTISMATPLPMKSKMSVPVAKQPLLAKFQDTKDRDWLYFQSQAEIRRQPALLGLTNNYH